MARANKGNDVRRAEAAASADQASRSGRAAQGDPTMDMAAGMENGMRLTREALAASLDQAQEMFKLALAMQQAQLRALSTAAGDLDQARAAIAEAQDPAALAAVPGRLLSVQWLHSLESASSIAEQLMQAEASWLQQAQAQASERFTALSAMVPSLPGLPNAPSADPSATAGDGAAQQWRQWFDSWQGTVEQMAHAWQDTMRNVQGSRPVG